MPRGKGTQSRYTAAETEAKIGWFSSADANTEQLADWDIKQDLLAATVLALLARGLAVTFGSAWDGQAVSITIHDDAGKKRKYVRDSIEFDDALAAALRHYRRQVEEEKSAG